MTVQLECFVESVRFIEYLTVVLYINIWAAIIQTFRLSETHPGPNEFG